jgi:hypothetical protein
MVFSNFTHVSGIYYLERQVSSEGRGNNMGEPLDKPLDRLKAGSGLAVNSEL